MNFACVPEDRIPEPGRALSLRVSARLNGVK